MASPLPPPHASAPGPSDDETPVAGAATLPPGLTRSRLAGRLGRAAVFALGAVAAVVGSIDAPVGKGDRREAVAKALAGRGLEATAEDVVFVDGPPGALGAFTRARALVRARPASEVPGEIAPSEVYLVTTRLSPTGALLEVLGAYDLSETTGADESVPVVRGHEAAFVSLSEVEGAPSTVTWLDLRGEGAPGDFGRFERAQHAVTQLQRTGGARGVARRTFVVEGKSGVAVGFEEGGLAIERDGRRALVTRTPGGELPPWISVEPLDVARPGNLTTWAVDRVRAEIGDDSMQAIKQVAFTALDFVLRNKEELTGDTGEDAIAQDLGGDPLAAPERSLPVDPELGWPPPPLEPWVTPALPGEGQWNAKEEPAWYPQQAGLPSAFLTTFIRSDRMRKATRVYVVVWDPRRVELHMMAGTVEPKSATGNAGPGLIPRTPDVMKRVVAATNAGFQALHGEYGMMADGTVYLPPKPYAATVAKLRDGSTAFGTWPDDPTIPDTIVSYRQNMTVMVQDEKFNPYDRTWWGGTVPGAEDKTHTVRTGICLTREGFVGYFYGADLSPDALAQSMIQARCKYGLALDMNAGHAGLEFYNVAPTNLLAPLDRPLQRDWEAEGDVPDLPGWSFRSRRFVRGMGLMNFPRYIKREARDFFYLTLRHVLPGPALATAISPPLEGEGTFDVKGLPHHGFPYALARTTLRPDAAAPEARFTVLAIDPRTLGVGRGGSGKTVAVVDAGAAEGSSLWLTGGGFVIGAEAPERGAARLASGAPDAATGAAVLGVHDESGVLYYAEGAGEAGSVRAMSESLAKLGCGERIVLTKRWSLALGGDTSLSGEAVRAPEGADVVRLVRSDAPSGRRVFEDTPVVPRDVWYPKQQHRVRYFKKRDE